MKEFRARLVDETLDRSFEAAPFDQIRGMRLKLAGVFLNDILYPAIGTGEVIDVQEVRKMLVTFREEHRGEPGESFDDAHVLGIAFEESHLAPTSSERVTAAIASDLLYELIFEG